MTRDEQFTHAYHQRDFVSRRSMNHSKRNETMRKKVFRFRKIFVYLCFISINFIVLSSLFIDVDWPLLDYFPFSLLDVFLVQQIDLDDPIDFNTTNIDFVTHLSPFYPQLSLIVERQDLPKMKKEKKLILLANGFFENPSWGFVSSALETMETLKCPFLVDYCQITTDLNVFSQADAIVYHMRDAINQRFARRRRRRRQRFVFALWESPAHSMDLTSFRHFFNWTMTYRFDSDIVSSYYLGDSYFHRSNFYYRQMIAENPTLTMKFVDDRPSKEILAKKTFGTIGALISNCGGQSRRLSFIRQLEKFIDVKIYGKCGQPCPTENNCREMIAEKFYFFLSFENSLCTDYTTEKFFATLSQPIVPIVFGRTNYSVFIPRSGFIDANEFSSINDLANFIWRIRNDTEKYLEYFAWKKDYVWGLGQFFRSFCDLCLRLHFDRKTKILDDIHSWWHRDTCVPSKFL